MGFIKGILYNFSQPAFLNVFKKQNLFPYHHLVRDNKVPHIENLYEYKNEAQFRSDLDFLLKHYKPLDPAVLGNGDLSRNSFLLTFDDGLEEIYSVIFPILKAKKINAIFFINPDFVDNQQSLYKHDISVAISDLKSKGFPYDIVKAIADELGIQYSSNDDFIKKFKDTKFVERKKIEAALKILNVDMQDYLRNNRPYVTKAQIQEMIDAGFYFGGHTMSHPPLGQLSLEEQKNEVIGSIEWLKTHFGISYSMFAFPFTDKTASKALIDALVSYDKKIVIFGNSGMKRDTSPNIIQRFSLENPNKKIEKQLVAENLYKLYNKVVGQYKIRRR